ncbi:MAG: hypothetical protein Q4D05_03260 [Acinetobacter sp.]|nr:hypothetical protein [Acinetobacter sp.]
MQVFFSQSFSKKLVNFPRADQLKIKAFKDHIQQHGFIGLKGRNKSSDNVPKDNPKWLETVKHAQANHLWHYHIGIPEYIELASGECVSQYVLHYVLGDGFIKIVDLSPHPPLELPQNID